MIKIFGDSVKACTTAALLVLLGAVCLSSSTSYAQCSGPAANAGAREWFAGDSNYRLCNGSDWVDFACGRVGGCTPTSVTYESEYDSGNTDPGNGWARPHDSAATEDGNTLAVIYQYWGVMFLDISSSPSAPTYMGDITVNPDYSDSNDIEVYGDYAFIAVRGGPHLISTDFSNPYSPATADTVVSSPTNEMTNIWGLGITADGQYAVTASWQSGSNNECHIHVIDISDPTNMSEVGHTDFSGVSGSGIYCTDVAIYGDYAFVSFADGTTSGGIGVVDISTKTAPSAVEYQTQSSGDKAEHIALSDDGQYAFVANRDDASISSFDISTPTAVSYLDNYQNTSYLTGVNRLDVSGETLIATSPTNDAFEVLDISDPSNMTYVTRYTGTTYIEDYASVSIVDRYVYVGGYDSASVAVFDLGCVPGVGLTCNTLGACTTTAEMEWDATETSFRYCDGSDWVEIDCQVGSCPTSLGACTTVGEIEYSSGVLYQCDGSIWKPMTGGLGSSGGLGVYDNTIILTSGSSWSVPADWNSSNNAIHVIGGGGGGSSVDGGAGGGGGAYSMATNISLTPSGSVSYAIGSGGSFGDPNGSTGGDTYFCNSTSNCGSIGGSAVVAGAVGGQGGQSGTGGVGGAAGSGVGPTKRSGGDGGYSTDWGGGGGGGAGGPNGGGGDGGDNDWEAGAGGGGGGGGSAGGYVANSDDNGAAGGNNSSGSGSGAGGGTTGNGSAGSDGGGGGGGGGDAETSGGAGGNGIEWTTAGSGGGGGGAGSANNSNSENGGNGGLYGGGGGGAAQQGANGGSGAQGVIIIQYTP